MDAIIITGGAFVLCMLGQYTAAALYVFAIFVAGLNTNAAGIVWFLAVFVSVLFNRFRKSSG